MILTPEETAEIAYIKNSMIENAFRYFERSLDGFENNHEYDFPIVDFYCGAEILVKVILIEKDYNMIFVEPGDASIEKLKNSEGRTVGLDEATKRIFKFVYPKLDNKFFNYFSKLRDDRNKLVHLYHPTVSRDRNNLAIKLSLGWVNVVRIFNHPYFEDTFRNFHSRFANIDSRLSFLENFLDSAANGIRQRHEDVDQLKTCPACARDTFEYGHCLLCHYQESHDELDARPPLVNCPMCEEELTVVPTIYGSRCKNPDCKSLLPHIIQCEYCGEWSIKEYAWDEDHQDIKEHGSYYWGCGTGECNGYMGYQMSKDD